MSNREEFEKYEFSKKPEASKELMFQRFTSDDLGIDEQGYVGKYYNSFMQEKWELWQARVPEGYMVVPKESSPVKSTGIDYNYMDENYKAK